MDHMQWCEQQGLAAPEGVHGGMDCVSAFFTGDSLQSDKKLKCWPG